MSNSVQLLKMLEPAVRPHGTPAPSASPNEPIESQSFESILEQTRQLNTLIDSAAQPAAAPESTAPNHPKPVAASLVNLLAGVDRVDNASLRKLIAGSQEPKA